MGILGKLGKQAEESTFLGPGDSGKIPAMYGSLVDNLKQQRCSLQAHEYCCLSEIFRQHVDFFQGNV